MNRVLQILVALAAIMFIVTGLRWLVAPAGVAPMFGLTLAGGVGLSSQVGDMSAFFLTLGTCMLVALLSGHRIWFYPPIILLGLAALGRVIAWLVHDAALAVDLIALEIIVAALLLVASRRLPEQA